ncbi:MULTISPECIES: phosphoribosylformylglycinamidine synthase subunit PurS [unclassified Prochlorococcus]|uniref:phosphoribosylformylglycinamidine synthase subunit PurS n=1 Tax=unclassified Prochlorococcus TaxID=2627481 RepID=UPI00068DBA60|nr:MULTISPECIES: phosphoribosylformylglycinamidine synthase subunit PurS [unclassified Prochlorococcus]
MPVFKAKVTVQLRSSVLDPAGEAAKSAAIKLGIKGVTRLRIGKSIDIDVEASDMEEARLQIAELSDKLLANPVIEDWDLELNPSDSVPNI